MKINEFTNYLESVEIDLSEYFKGEAVIIQLREMNEKEFRILAECDKYISESKESYLLKYIEMFLKILPDLIIDHPFTTEKDEPCSPKAVSDQIRKSAKMSNYVAIAYKAFSFPPVTNTKEEGAEEEGAEADKKK